MKRRAGFSQGETKAKLRTRTLAVAALLLACWGALALGPRAPRAEAQNTLPGRIIASTGDSQGGIIEFNADGSNVVNLTSNTFDGGCSFSGAVPRYKDTHATVSRDGRLVAFQSNRDGTGFRIFVMNSDGTNLRQLTFNPGTNGSRPDDTDQDFNPEISPDGTKVAFISARTHTTGAASCPDTPIFSAYIVSTDGGSVTPATATDFVDSNGHCGLSEIVSVAWAPDSRRIVYRGTRLLTVGTPPQQEFHKVVAIKNWDEFPVSDTILDTLDSTGQSRALDWSPDGRRIGVVFGGEAQGAPQPRVIIYDLQTSGRSELFTGQNLGLLMGPGSFRFSPDGQRFLVARLTDFNFSTGVISLVNVDGSGQMTNVTPPAGNPVVPFWWQGGAAIPTPARLELIPSPVVVRSGGPSVQMYPTLYDAQGNVIVRAATAWQVPCGGDFPIGVTQTGLLTANQTTASFTDQVCASNGGIQSCAVLFENPAANKIDEAEFFVRQHYADFLNRAGDQSGINFWTNEITSCGASAGCVDVKRVNVSQAFFLSIEFQRTGYLIVRFYKETFTDSAQRPRGLPRMQEFLADTQAVSAGVIVGQSGWEQKLEENRQAFARQWVQRPEVLVQLPSTMTAAQFVDKLFQNSEVTPTTAERNAAIAAFGAGGTDGRAAALRSVADSGSVYNRQYNPAFVLMQYIGYLRRNPNDAPDTNYNGYDFWLGKMNSVSLPGEDMRNDSQAQARAQRGEMVRAFIVAQEYRRRFGP